MKSKIKFENIFVVLSLLFIFGCCCFYGSRLVKYYKVFNPKTETGETVEIFSATVRKANPVITEGDGLYISNGDFIFKGEEFNNYVSYADKIWRILRVNRNGSVKLVLDEPLTNMVYDSNDDSYEGSEIYEYIHDENNLKLDTNKLVEMTVCLDNVDDASNITCTSSINDYVSILNITEYFNTVNSVTQKSFINNAKNIWLSSKTSENLVWNIADGIVRTTYADYEYAVKPVITLKGTAFSSKGDGSKADPYVVEVGE